MADLRAFINDPRYQALPEEAKRKALKGEFGVEDSDMGTLLAYQPPQQEEAAPPTPASTPTPPPPDNSFGAGFREGGALGFAGATQVPGALRDLAAAGPKAATVGVLKGLGSTISDVAKSVGGATSIPYMDAVPQDLRGAQQFTPPLPSVATDIEEGNYAKAAGRAVNLAPLAIGPIGKASGKLGQAATNSAQKAMSQTLGATTKDLKRLSEQIVPELTKREPVALTRKSLLNKVGASVNDARTNLDAALDKVPADLKVDLNKAYSALDDLKTNHQMQNVAGELVPANSGAAATIKAIDSLQQSLLDLDPSYGSVRKFRQILDKQVTAGGKTFGRTISEGTVLDVTREGANAIRNVLAEATPDIAKLNKELSFWLNAKQVLGATVERTASQATPLGVTVSESAGLAGGLARGNGAATTVGIAKAFGAAKSIIQSTGWRTAGILVKNRLARALMNNDASEISAVGRFVTKRPVLLVKPQPTPEPES